MLQLSRVTAAGAGRMAEIVSINKHVGLAPHIPPANQPANPLDILLSVPVTQVHKKNAYIMVTCTSTAAVLLGPQI